MSDKRPWRVYPSGAEKRRQIKNEKASLSKVPKLTSFFKSKAAANEEEVPGIYTHINFNDLGSYRN